MDGMTMDGRIAFLVPEFPNTTETFILGQVLGLLRTGADVEIISAYRSWNNHVEHPELQEYDLGARTRYVPMPDASAMELPVWPLRGDTWLPGAERPLRNSMRLLAATPVIGRTMLRAPRLARALLDEGRYGDAARSLSAVYRFDALWPLRGRYAVVHAQFGPVANDFRFVAPSLGVPLVVSFYGYDFSLWPAQHGFDAYRELFDVATAVTALSEYLARRLVELGCPPEKVVRLNIGIDVDRFEFRVPQPEAEVRALTVGRLVAKKGMADTITAVAAARAAGAPLQLEIIGDGPLRGELEALASRLGVGELVTFYGARDSAFVRDAMRRSHLFVLASRTSPEGDEEGTPVVLMEAMAAGLPVISTRHSGIPEMVRDGTSGLLVDEGDVDGLAACLTRLAAAPEAWAPLAEAARRYVEAHHDLPAVTGQLLRLYESVAP